MKRLLLSVILVLFLCFPCWSATYYVDKDGGDDSNDGSELNPWEHCPGMIGYTGGGSLSAGDTVYFDSSDTWDWTSGLAFIEAVGGVKYDGDTWGGGTRAILRTNWNPPTGNYSLIYIRDDDSSDDTEFEGFELNLNEKIGTGITINRNATKSLTGATKRIDNCVVHDQYSGGTDEYARAIAVGATNNYDTSDVEFIDCTVYNTRKSAINVYAANDVDCTISDVTIRGCVCYDNGEYDSQGADYLIKNQVENCTVEYCTSSGSSGRGVMIDSDSSSLAAATGIDIRYNIIRNHAKGGIYFGRGGTGTRDVDIYGNIIYDNTNYAIYFETTLVGTISCKIYNNTCFESELGEICITSSSATFSTLDIRNNILQSLTTGTPLRDITGSRITDHSDNVYHRPGGGNLTLVQDGGTTYKNATITTWEASALSDDPELKNTANLPTSFTGTYGVDMEPDVDGLAVGTDSPCIDDGYTVGSPYNSSINTQSRPQDAGYEIGAYEYVVAQAVGVVTVGSSGADYTQVESALDGEALADNDTIRLITDVTEADPVSWTADEGTATGDLVLDLNGYTWDITASVDNMVVMDGVDYITIMGPGEIRGTGCNLQTIAIDDCNHITLSNFDLYFNSNDAADQGMRIYTSAATSTDILIERVWFQSLDGNGFGYPLFIVENPDDLTVRCCVFYLFDHAIRYDSTAPNTPTNQHVYNNTFYDGDVALSIIADVESDNLTFYNNIFAECDDYGVYDSDAVNNPTMNYNNYYNCGSDVDGCTKGGNSVTTNPVFTDVSSADFSLQVSSPARNAGYNTALSGTANVLDFAGVPLTDPEGDITAPGGVVPMGAYDISGLFIKVNGITVTHETDQNGVTVNISARIEIPLPQ